MLLSVFSVKPTFCSLHLTYHFFSFLKISLRTQYRYFLCFPCGSDSKESPAVQETWVQSLGWEDPLEEGIATHSSTLAWRQRSLLGYSPWGCKELAMAEQQSTAQLSIDISYPQWNSFGMVLITNLIFFNRCKTTLVIYFLSGKLGLSFFFFFFGLSFLRNCPTFEFVDISFEYIIIIVRS